MSADERTVPFHLVGGGRSDPSAVTAREVGSKAFGLMRMDALGLAVPPAVVLGTELCARYHEAGGRLPEGFRDELSRAVAALEAVCGRRLGAARRPLFVSVRSGAAASMPGMMETLLDVGLNDESVRGLLRATGNPRLAWDSYRRLVRTFAEVVRGLRPEPFEELVRRRLGPDCPSPRAIDFAGLRELARESLELYAGLARAPFPQDPMEQLAASVEAVLRSWRAPKAVEYRRMQGIPEAAGTAVTIQQMVFGNSGGASGSGVGFSRDPATGEARTYYEFLFNAQGEDVVSGTQVGDDSERFRRELPELEAELARVARLLEREFGDMQDFEFTVENGRLHLLQTRAAKRTPWAALHVALALEEEGALDARAALALLDGIDLDGIGRARLRGEGAREPLAKAVAASIGIASGAVVFDSERAKERAARGPVLLLRDATATEDVAGMAVAAGILTRAGGRTSHAAVVARQLGKVCLVGCAELRVEPERRRCTLAGRVFEEGALLTLDAERGCVYAGRVELEVERPTEALERVARLRAAIGAR